MSAKRGARGQVLSARGQVSIMTSMRFPLVFCTALLLGCGHDRADLSYSICEVLVEQKPSIFSEELAQMIYYPSIQEIISFPLCYHGKYIATNGAIKIDLIDDAIVVFPDKDRAFANSYNSSITTSIKKNGLINFDPRYFEQNVTIGSIVGKFHFARDLNSPSTSLTISPVVSLRVDVRLGDEDEKFDDRLFK